MRDRVTHRAYLAEVFSAELDDREARRRERRIVEARFPRLKRLAEFDLGAAPSINPATLATLETGAWIDAGEPVVLPGDSGTGRTRLLIGLGLAACEGSSDHGGAKWGCHSHRRDRASPMPCPSTCWQLPVWLRSEKAESLPASTCSSYSERST